MLYLKLSNKIPAAWFACKVSPSGPKNPPPYGCKVSPPGPKNPPPYSCKISPPGPKNPLPYGCKISPWCIPIVKVSTEHGLEETYRIQPPPHHTHTCGDPPSPYPFNWGGEPKLNTYTWKSYNLQPIKPILLLF